MDDQEVTMGAMQVSADLYTHHLYLAHFGRDWAASVRAEADRESGALEAEYLLGYAQALSDIAEHLEAGEALPGGPLYSHVAQRIARNGPRH